MHVWSILTTHIYILVPILKIICIFFSFIEVISWISVPSTFAYSRFQNMDCIQLPTLYILGQLWFHSSKLYSYRFKYLLPVQQSGFLPYQLQELQCDQLERSAAASFCLCSKSITGQIMAFAPVSHSSSCCCQNKYFNCC